MDPVFERLSVAMAISFFAMAGFAAVGLVYVALACGAIAVVLFVFLFVREFRGLRPIYRDEGDGTRTRIGWKD